VEPATLGDPERPLRCVSKSMDKLAAALTAMGHPKAIKISDAEMTALDITGNTSILSGTIRSSPATDSVYWSGCP
jgi:hypothetical protein